MPQQMNVIDQLIINFDQGLRTVFGKPLVTGRPDPAAALAETDLTDTEKQLSMRLMRVNHAGEVSAQALYQGQALTARDAQVRHSLQRSAQEENDHLRWCQDRVEELEGRVSLLNPVWYAGSFVIGAAAGIAGDKVSLGFVAETEKQVVEHLDEHLTKVSANDSKTRAILTQMQTDEAHHATVALENGGVSLPQPVQWMMGRVAQVMTRTAFWV